MGMGRLCRRQGGFVRYVLAIACALLPLLGTATVAVRAADPPILQTAVVHTGASIGRTNAQQQITLSVPLKVARQGDLDTFLRDLSNPVSPSFHRYLSSAAFTKRFVDAGARKQVADFLRAKNLTVTDSGLGTVVTATGTAAQVESAFSVTLSDYRDSAGQVFFGNDRTAALPTSIAALTDGVLGLDNAPAEQPHFVQPPLDPQAGGQSENPHFSSGCTAAVTVANTYGSFTPNQLSTAYNFDFFATNGLHGEGQTVALFEADDYLDSNAAAYQTCFGTAVPVARVPVDGGTTPGSGEVEVELDIDVITGMAPQLGQLLVYESPNTQAAAIDQYQRIANDNVAQVVSTSWGNCEPNRTAAVLNARYAIFQQMAAQGQSMFAAAGDNGSEDCQSGASVNAITVDDPASQPFVTGVGGTRLTINGSTNQYSSEAVWNRYVTTNGAGGGGISTIWPKPSYQVGPGTVNGYSNGKRQVPDVTADADPNTGYAVFIHDATHCPARNGTANCFAPIGGTSAAAPLWAAATALMNQYLAALGSPRTGFVNPQIYPYLANVSSPSATHPFPFHDITVGDNCYKPASGCGSPNSGTSAYYATVAYDQASGIGSMNASGLVAALASPIISSLSRSIGQAAGGTTLSITGAFFQTGATVSFGGAPATNVTVVSSTQITATTPAHALGSVDVTVTNPNGRAGVGAGLFTYVSGPAITSLSPPNGDTAGGTAITIGGTGFQSGATVTIGGSAAAAVTVVNATQITCITPASTSSAGPLTVAADIIVTNPDGTFGTLRGGFAYQQRPGPVIPGGPPQPIPVPRT